MNNIKQYIQEKLIINKDIKANTNIFSFKNTPNYKDITISLPFDIYVPKEHVNIQIHFIECAGEDLSGTEVYKFFDKDKNYILSLTNNFGIEKLFFSLGIFDLIPFISSLNGKKYLKSAEIKLKSNACILNYEKRK